MKRLLIKIRDRITYSRLTNFMRLWLAIVVRLFKQRESVRLDLLMRAYRLAESKGLRKWLDGKIAPYLSGPRQSIWREDRIGWSRYSGWLANPRLTRTLILKAPRADGEKGALLVVTDYNWLRLFVNIPDLRALEEEYFLILSTSWSPADYAIIATGLTCWRGPLFIQACNYKEIPKLNEFHPRVHCLPTIACDWINPDLFQPKPHAQRQTDILMVANWEPFKRHWQLFDALRQLPRDLRITLIGQ